MSLVRTMVFTAMPLVDRELGRWAAVLDACPDPELRTQALASMHRKRFHAIGGSVYGVEPRPDRGLVALIVAYQTLSDYLDNLCDRAGVQDPAALRQLHLSMLDALMPIAASTDLDRGARDYYALYPRKSDGGYVQALVDECRTRVSSLPSYAAVADRVARLASLYCDLQTYKHAPEPDRVGLLTAWFERERGGLDGLRWWEFAAACGSTLGVFALLRLAAMDGCAPDLVARTHDAYFPWVCALHILLDYLIDLDEDARAGDLNFVAFYADARDRLESMRRFLDAAVGSASGLPGARLHARIVRGLVALYLSDPKARRAEIAPVARALLRAGGPDAWTMWIACRVLRVAGAL